MKDLIELVGAVRFSEYVIESVFDGDWETKNSNVAYSTSARQVLTIWDMINYNNKGWSL